MLRVVGCQSSARICMVKVVKVRMCPGFIRRGEKECDYREIREICHIDLEVRADSKLVLGQNSEDQSLNTQCCENQKVETLS